MQNHAQYTKVLMQAQTCPSPQQTTYQIHVCFAMQRHAQHPKVIISTTKNSSHSSMFCCKSDDNLRSDQVYLLPSWWNTASRFIRKTNLNPAKNSRHFAPKISVLGGSGWDNKSRQLSPSLFYINGNQYTYQEGNPFLEIFVCLFTRDKRICYLHRRDSTWFTSH